MRAFIIRRFITSILTLLGAALFVFSVSRIMGDRECCCSRTRHTE